MQVVQSIIGISFYDHLTKDQSSSSFYVQYRVLELRSTAFDSWNLNEIFLVVYQTKWATMLGLWDYKKWTQLVAASDLTNGNICL